jgi:hypothetical protein
LPLMFHPIPPVLSGTDGKLNLHERASRLPVPKRGISNAGNNDRQVCAPRVPNARRSSDEGPRGRRQRLRNREAVQQPEVGQWLWWTSNQIDRDALSVFQRGNLEGCPDQCVNLTLSLSPTSVLSSCAFSCAPVLLPNGSLRQRSLHEG